MTMQGIDIASYQAGIDLSKVPVDFVIEKATQGVNYVNPDCDSAIQQCIKIGKLFGIWKKAGNSWNKKRNSEH